MLCIVCYLKTFRWQKDLIVYFFFFLELLEVQNYSVWLWSPLTITVYFWGKCSDFRLSQSTEPTYIWPSAATAIGNNRSYVNFTIQNVTREYEDVTMTVQAAGGSEDDVSHKSFTLDIYGEYLPFILYTCNVIVVWMKIHFCVHSTCCFVSVLCSRVKHLVLSVTCTHRRAVTTNEKCVTKEPTLTRELTFFPN